ncbi:hypothetical protein AGMMS50230_03290 [Spirochaetia bacterium]|nr:hypothetical protein AGMMS50230_03290 [Spirochaetia bacterium]
MFLNKKETFNIDKFWRDYETSIGEKVLAKSLARYLSGREEYPEPLWGLAIAAEKSFRFHHFPHEGWIIALSRITTGGEAPKEKTFTIPREQIVSVELVIEKRWWKKLLAPSNPLLLIHCRQDGTETTVAIETDRQAQAVVEALS